jgi:NAD(P)H dehydrogenase (quinone)
MILVTGAGGKTGKAVLRSLGSESGAVRALVKSKGQIPPETRDGVPETVVADLLSLAEMTKAMAEVQAVYLIAPNMHPEEIRIGEVAIAAARDAGVRRIVYHSVLHPQTRQMPHHWQKLAVEERLFESGLDFTILQPAAYMQNVLAFWDEIVEKGVYRVPYGESAALSLVDLEDVAEVAAIVLTEEEHIGATYELVGPEALTPRRIAEVLSRRFGTEVSSESIALDGWAEGARAGGLRGYQLESLSRMFRYYDRYGLIGGSRVLEWLLGRPPTSFHQFVDRITESE